MLIVNSLWYVHVVKDVTFAEKNDLLIRYLMFNR